MDLRKGEKRFQAIFLRAGIGMPLANVIAPQAKTCLTRLTPYVL